LTTAPVSTTITRKETIVSGTRTNATIVARSTRVANLDATAMMTSMTANATRATRSITTSASRTIER
jgi:hypothetical protein